MDYNILVRMALVKKKKTLKWLCEQVSNKTNKFCDNSYIHKLLSGERKAPDMIQAINEILEIEVKK